MRKRLVCGTLLLAAFTTLAADITLVWDTVAYPDMVSNCVYYGEAQGGASLSTEGTTNQWSYASVRTNLLSTNAVVALPTTVSTLSLSFTNSGQLYWFFAAGKDVWGNVSDPSNVLFWKNTRPAKPGNVKLKVVLIYNGD